MPEPNPTILLIEDDPSTRELYQRELSRDYAVLACGNESEALALLESHPVSLIVLEPVLQDGQGWSFLAMLHAMPRTRTIPIILCSTLDERRRGLELGATLYLTKPVLPVALREAVYQVTHSLING
jgi:CheY-like chemotaxis protein